jgi:hypothetical protein
VALTLVAIAILESLNDADLNEQLSRLPEACKDSKRKRQPQMRFISSA